MTRKSPETFFNYDTSFGEKRTPKHKSFPAILMTDDIQMNYSESNMQNIIFNRLYDENVFDNEQISYNNVFTHVNDETDDENCKANMESDVLLFAENHGYDILPSLNGCTYTTLADTDNSTNKFAVEDTPQFELTSRDLLQFAKQIAIGMVK